MKKIFYLIALFCSSFAMNAQTVVDVIVNSDDHQILEDAVIAADLATTLSGPGPYTVFAPTDDAFNMLPDGVLDALLADPEGDLTDILLYHVLGGSVMSGDLSDGQMSTTLNGDEITVTIVDGMVMINNAVVTNADIIADNGVVHVIDAVLIPPVTTVADIIIESEIHTTLEAAVIAADLVSTLQGDGPFTVFAPTDAAFDALPDGVLDALLADPEGMLTDILLYHVTGGALLSTDLSDGQMITTVNGADVTVTISDGVVTINDAQVVVANIEADNGVVHVIDAVLTPPLSTVADIIIESEVHETLEAAVIAADLVETLQGEGPFTVFAPTDDAFAALPDGVLDALLDDPEGMLTDILLYHVTGGAFLSTDLSDGQMITTINGSDVTVSIVDGDVFINSAQVIIANLEADNGVVHVIDAVLTPPLTTVADIIIESEVHETLEAALIAADLVETLQGDGPFTVFAPTDDAFAALPDGTLDALLDDPEGLLTDILLYHVASGSVLSTDLTDGQMITTINGADVTVTLDDGNVFINDAQVIIADLEADNGVVHVIDAVLLPPASVTVADIIIESEIHTTLEAALVAADLVETLQGDGPFTVFAPTDDAFAALPDGTLDALLDDPEGLLTDILLYHVASGSVLSTDLTDGQMITTINGADVTITLDDGNVFINDAQVIVADLEADNGVVHVIDAVLLPPTTTVVDIIVESEDHTILETALGAAGLIETLQGEGPFTVFAPTDAAFANLPDGALDGLLDDPMGALTDVLLYHVVSGLTLSTDLSDGQTIETLQGEDITVSIMGDVMINEATVTVADLEADNGVVHVIDAVLLPPSNVGDVNNITSDISVYPNPAINNVTIAGDVPAGAELNIYDNMGRSVYTSSFTGVSNIDVSNLSQGNYTLMIVAEGAIRVKQFMVK